MRGALTQHPAGKSDTLRLQLPENGSNIGFLRAEKKKVPTAVTILDHLISVLRCVNIYLVSRHGVSD